MTTFKLTRQIKAGKVAIVTVEVNNVSAYFNFIENYKGNDLLSDLICEDFVTNMYE